MQNFGQKEKDATNEEDSKKTKDVPASNLGPGLVPTSVKPHHPTLSINNLGGGHWLSGRRLKNVRSPEASATMIYSPLATTGTPGVKGLPSPPNLGAASSTPLNLSARSGVSNVSGASGVSTTSMESNTSSLASPTHMPLSPETSPHSVAIHYQSNSFMTSGVTGSPMRVGSLGSSSPPSVMPTTPPHLVMSPSSHSLSASLSPKDISSTQTSPQTRNRSHSDNTQNPKITLPSTLHSPSPPPRMPRPSSSQNLLEASIGSSATLGSGSGLPVARTTLVPSPPPPRIPLPQNATTTTRNRSRHQVRSSSPRINYTSVSASPSAGPVDMGSMTSSGSTINRSTTELQDNREKAAGGPGSHQTHTKTTGRRANSLPAVNRRVVEEALQAFKQQTEVQTSMLDLFQQQLQQLMQQQQQIGEAQQQLLNIVAALPGSDSPDGPMTPTDGPMNATTSHRSSSVAPTGSYSNSSSSSIITLASATYPPRAPSPARASFPLAAYSSAHSHQSDTSMPVSSSAGSRSRSGSRSTSPATFSTPAVLSTVLTSEDPKREPPKT